jgi:hypothetical protein
MSVCRTHKLFVTTSLSHAVQSREETAEMAKTPTTGNTSISQTGRSTYVLPNRGFFPVIDLRQMGARSCADEKESVTKTVTNFGGEPGAIEGNVTNSVTKLRGTEGNEINNFGAFREVQGN